MIPRFALWLLAPRNARVNDKAVELLVESGHMVVGAHCKGEWESGWAEDKEVINEETFRTRWGNLHMDW